MDLIIAPNSVTQAQADVAPGTGTPGWATDGNPSTNTPATIFPAYAFNAIQAELTNLIKGAGGTLDRTNLSQVLAAVQSIANSRGGVVGTARNLRAVLTAAGTSLTFTADEIILESALGGTPFRLASFNATLNVATTGADGMDTGAAPASGYVAIYAIYDPTTATAALLATNATAAAAPNVYGGANMPAGYTLSGLIAVWPTNGSGQLVGGYQADRKFSYQGVVSVLSASGISSSMTALGIGAAVPKNAKRVKGMLQIFNVPTTASYGFTVAGDTNNTEFEYMQSYLQAGTGYGASWPFEVPPTTAQTIAYAQSGTNTGGTYSININGYTI